jgi:hypothetical protein
VNAVAETAAAARRGRRNRAANFGFLVSLAGFLMTFVPIANIVGLAGSWIWVLPMPAILVSTAGLAISSTARTHAKRDGLRGGRIALTGIILAVAALAADTLAFASFAFVAWLFGY